MSAGVLQMQRGDCVGSTSGDVPGSCVTTDGLRTLRGMKRDQKGGWA